MISREEYERAVDTFLMELHATCVALEDQHIDRMSQDFKVELQDAIEGLRDPGSTASDIVARSFGVMDEFVHTIWDELMIEGYALYMDMSGGQSHRHPGTRPNQENN
jgi:hypothetical protein